MRPVALPFPTLAGKLPRLSRARCVVEIPPKYGASTDAWPSWESRITRLHLNMKLWNHSCSIVGCSERSRSSFIPSFSILTVAQSNSTVAKRDSLAVNRRQRQTAGHLQEWQVCAPFVVFSSYCVTRCFYPACVAFPTITSAMEASVRLKEAAVMKRRQAVDIAAVSRATRYEMAHFSRPARRVSRRL